MDLHKKSVARAYAHIARTQYQTIAGSGKHAIVVDEPESYNGTDTAMSPFPLLLSSLGSCTIITLRMYADRKMWVVDEIRVDLELFAVDGGHLIERNLSIKGALTDEQLKRLEEIADACPVHKMLTGNIMIETNLV
ncbi:OsmC family protein [Mucilaginibacter sp. Bleaf8]|uniref:OsmC family protein n=1 Tax=Mucilaginibacter sp. Bleaf8 TaxID=2834430 RepID=UPI001BCAF66C|nr:OsmC family protein [Mucilaginibacter sp. Bleaf8]MBS7565233.1 OsmC family protein [Mucilaginibacter sp. Bleaf8]